MGAAQRQQASGLPPHPRPPAARDPLAECGNDEPAQAPGSRCSSPSTAGCPALFSTAISPPLLPPLPVCSTGRAVNQMDDWLMLRDMRRTRGEREGRLAAGGWTHGTHNVRAKPVQSALSASIEREDTGNTDVLHGPE